MSSLQEATLIAACKEGDTDTIAKLFSEQTDNNDDTDLPPLWKKSLQWTDEEQRNLETPAFFIAVDYNQISVVRQLLERDISLLNVRDSDDYTPLQWASTNGNLELVRVLVEEHGATVDQDASDLAKEHGHTEVVALLKQHMQFSYTELGDDVDAIMIKASREGDVEKVQELIADEYDFDKWKMEDGSYQEYSPIYIAMKNGHVDIIREFLQAGVEAELHATHFNHQPPTAIESNMASPIELLEEQLETVNEQMLTEQVAEEEEKRNEGTHKRESS